MTPTMNAAAAARRVRVAALLHIEMPGHDIRLVDGSGVVSFDGQLFTGSDAVFGSWDQIDELTEEVGDSAPGIIVTLIPPAAIATADVAAAAMQGARVRVWIAVVDDDTGAVLPDPILQFEGEVDVATPELDRGERRVRYEIASVFDRLLEPDEGIRLSSGHHQSIFPTEKGFDQMTGTTLEKIWGPGSKAPVTTRV